LGEQEAEVGDAVGGEDIEDLIGLRPTNHLVAVEVGHCAQVRQNGQLVLTPSMA
jgi:hypothetical protein